MKQINLDNYEAFLLDYLEGNATEAIRVELEAFLLSHPELNIDLAHGVLPKCIPENIDVDFKIYLKKTELDFPDEALLKYVEGQLSEAELKLLESKLLVDSELVSDLKQYQSTVLKPDHLIYFENKNSLLKDDDDWLLNDRALNHFENNLNIEEPESIEASLKNNSLLLESFNLISKTKLEPDFDIVYPNKNALKKKNRVLFLFDPKVIGALAAAVLFLIGLVVLFNRYNSNSEIKKYELSKKEKSPVIDSQLKNKTSLETDKSTAAANEIVIRKKSSVRKNFTQVQEANRAVSPAEFVAKSERNESTPILDKEEVKGKEADLLETKPEVFEKHNDLLLVASEDFEAIETEVADGDNERLELEKKGFWAKAVTLAKRANRLGVKSIEGVEAPNNRFLFSFHDFTVERR